MSRQRIVITRPQQDSDELAEAIIKAGFDILIEPLLTIEELDFSITDIQNDTPLIFTSANGVRAFCRLYRGRENKVYTVGPQTAEEAGLQGFTDIDCGAGTASDIVKLVLLQKDTLEKIPYYFRAAEISYDIAAKLAENGVNIAEIIVYKTEYAENMSISLLKSLDSKEISGILFFSRKAAQVFADLIEQYGRWPRLKTVSALCLSQGVADVISAIPFQQRLVASQPDRYGMIELLEKFSVNQG